MTTVASPDAPMTSPPSQRFAASPVASCSSVGCHGGGAVGRTGSEQSTWAAGDPHATAYRILFNDDSTRITTNLRKADPNRPAAPKDVSCVACHTAGTNACYDGTTIANASDGVGCDACHGSSSQWLSKHYEPFWKSLSADEKASQFGFRSTKDLVARITACVGCHVGDATREVNHDLIAAGHPRLAFEYTRYHFSPRYTKHWTEPLPNRDFEVRAWAIGQVVAAKATVDLLSSRVERTKDVRLELAEQGCFQCHKGLNGTPKSEIVRGTADWQPWYLSLLDVVAVETPTLFPNVEKPDLASVHSLVVEMQKPRPGVIEVKALSNEVGKMLSRWLNEIRESEKRHSGPRISSDDVRRLTAAVAKNAASRNEWDAVAPHFLAATALYHADPSAVASARGPLDELKPFVNYRAGSNSPGNFDAVRVRDLFRQLAVGVGR